MKELQVSRRKAASLLPIQGAPPPLASRQATASLLGVDDGRDDMGTCPHCHLTLPIAMLRRHQVNPLHHTKRYTVEGLPW